VSLILLSAAAEESVNPLVGSIAISGVGPTTVQGTRITPTVGSISVSGVAVSMGHQMTPLVGSIGFSSVAHTYIHGEVLVTVLGSVSFSGIATTSVNGFPLTPGVGSAVFAGTAPSFIDGTGIVPSIGTLSVSGVVSSLFFGDQRIPNTGMIEIQSTEPTVQSIEEVNPTSGSMSLNGVAPSPFIEDEITPTTGTLALIGYGSSFAEKYPPSGSLSFTTYPPTQVPNVSIDPIAGSILLSGQVPDPFIGSIDPPVGNLIISGNAPSLGITHVVTPPVGSLSIVGQTPSYSQEIFLQVTQVTITGYAPTVSVSESEGTRIIPTGIIEIDYAYGYPLERIFNSGLDTIHQATSEDKREWSANIYPFVPSTLPIALQGTVLTIPTGQLNLVGYETNISAPGGDTKVPGTVAWVLTGYAPDFFSGFTSCPVTSVFPDGILTIEPISIFVTPPLYSSMLMITRPVCGPLYCSIAFLTQSGMSIFLLF